MANADIDAVLLSDEAEEEWIAVEGYEQVPYSDDDAILIDASVIADAVQEQIVNYGEQNSQYIVFIRNRYQDGIDLAGVDESCTDMEIHIAYQRADGEQHIEKCVNVEYTEGKDGKIRYGWVISNTALAVAGELDIATYVTGVVTDKDKSVSRAYGLTDLYAKLTVHESVINSSETTAETRLTLYVTHAVIADSASALVHDADYMHVADYVTEGGEGKVLSAASADSVEWDNVQNKPDVMTEDVYVNEGGTGKVLAAALADKLADDNTDYLKTTGGTVSGDVTVQGEFICDSSEKSVSSNIVAKNASGQVFLQTQTSATGNNIIAVTNAAGSSKAIISADQNNNATFVGNAITATTATTATTANSLADTVIYSNPNLLDNWYFVNPVNQRGSTSYTGNSYCTIDRWFTWNDVTITDSGVKVSYASTYTGNRFFAQYITPEIKKAIAGKTVTFSVLSSDTNLYFKLTDSNLALAQPIHKDVPITSNLTTYTFTCKAYSDISSDYSYVGIWCNTADNAVNIIAAKLEIGDRQTLCHKEGSTWVLNEIPDYGEQLRRCQRYYYKINHRLTLYQANYNVSNTNYRLQYTFPVEMASTPSYSFTSYQGSVSIDGITRQYFGLLGTCGDGGWCSAESGAVFYIPKYGE